MQEIPPFTLLTKKLSIMLKLPLIFMGAGVQFYFRERGWAEAYAFFSSEKDRCV